MILILALNAGKHHKIHTEPSCNYQPEALQHAALRLCFTNKLDHNAEAESCDAADIIHTLSHTQVYSSSVRWERPHTYETIS